MKLDDHKLFQNQDKHVSETYAMVPNTCNLKLQRSQSRHTEPISQSGCNGEYLQRHPRIQRRQPKQKRRKHSCAFESTIKINNRKATIKISKNKINNRKSKFQISLARITKTCKTSFVRTLNLCMVASHRAC